MFGGLYVSKINSFSFARFISTLSISTEDVNWKASIFLHGMFWVIQNNKPPPYLLSRSCQKNPITWNFELSFWKTSTEFTLASQEDVKYILNEEH